MQWTMKYAPRCKDDIMGNDDTVQELADWLGLWAKRGLKCKGSGDSSSVSPSSSEDEYSSFSTSEDEEAGEELPNTALLIGPSGVGKTASVYALAHEMGFKVLEVNASTSRNGRQVLANLREATQSHDVRKPQSKTETTAAATLNTSNNKKAALALILFEDIDLVFEEADESGFYAAVNSLIASTKRPILLTTSSSAFLPMQMGRHKVLKNLPRAFHFEPVQPEDAASNLHLLALAEGFALDRGSLDTLAGLCGGSVSRMLLSLQCYTQMTTTSFEAESLLLEAEQSSKGL